MWRRFMKYYEKKRRKEETKEGKREIGQIRGKNYAEGKKNREEKGETGRIRKRRKNE